MVRTLILTLSAWRAQNVPASLGNDRRAVTALEYGIIASILGLVLVGIFSSFGKTLTTLFSHVATSI
jgi:Flp pilus assembly pilin Flp